MQSLDLLGQLARSEHDNRQRRAELRRLTAERRLALTTQHPLEPAELPATGAGAAPRWWPALETGLCLQTPPAPQRVLLTGRPGVSATSATGERGDSAVAC